MLKVSVLQLFCFIEFYRVGQLYSDKHLTPMMSNKCIWYISTRECLNRKKPHPSWELQKHACTQSPTNAPRWNITCWDFNAQCSCINTTQCIIYWPVMPMYNFLHTNSYQNDNKESVTALPCPETQSEGVVDVPVCSERGALRFWAGGWTGSQSNNPPCLCFDQWATAIQLIRQQSNSKLSNNEHHGKQAEPYSLSLTHTHADTHPLRLQSMAQLMNICLEALLC